MKISRGHFLTTCGAALLAARVDARSVLVAPGSNRAGDFHPHMNSVFVVRSTMHPALPLVLTSVVEGAADERIEQFSVVFDGPASASLPDGTYEFRHKVLGRFDLFIVPVGMRNSRQVSYEACFTRLRSAG